MIISIMLDYFMNKNTFCILPHIHQMIRRDKAHSENIYSIITYLKKPVNNEKQGLIKFKKFNDMLDQKRKVQLADYVPNLAKQL